jgi:hypothetical protein
VCFFFVSPWVSFMAKRDEEGSGANIARAGLYHGQEGRGGFSLCFGCQFFMELCLMAFSIVCMVLTT